MGMKAELIFVGSELLLGHILNTNAVFLGLELAELGLDCHHQSVVGDNTKRLQEVLMTALKRSDLIITTGGLGPTVDDLTHESITDLFGVESIDDPAVLQKIEALFLERKKSMPPTNSKQAQRPTGSISLNNPKGTAPGIIWEVSALCAEKLAIVSPNPKWIITFPGVPSEMKAMWQETAKPYLQAQNPSTESLYSRSFKFCGVSESAMAERVFDLFDSADPTIAPLASLGECRLRVSTKAPSLAIAQQKWSTIEALIEQRLGEYLFGYDQDTLESVCAALLIAHKQTLALAESCTGGLLSQRLTSLAGSSSFTGLNLITYSNESKMEMLGVKPESLENYGAVSAQVALEMAAGAKTLAKSDLGLAVTGIAGPAGGSQDKPVGLVYIALVAGDGYGVSQEYHFGQGKREEIRWRSSQEALNLLRKYLQGKKSSLGENAS